MTTSQPQRGRTPSQLRVLMSGQPAGWLRRDEQGRVSLRYDTAYASSRTATPLSIKLPLTEEEHRGRPLLAWLANLLPDNDRVLARWAAKYQVSAGSPYALLAHVGADCAGAVQFLREDQLEQVPQGGLTPLTDAEVGDLLRALAADPAAWTPLHEGGQFSLAGAQAKVALHWDGQRWSEPWGREPSTHILKPPMPSLAYQEINEHLCLRIARHLDLPAASSQVRTIGGQQVIAVERYDRIRAGDQLLRLHQEDLCQALGVMPANKYQAEGGPGAADIVSLLRRVMPATYAEAAIGTFLDALALSWVLAATDAHAKNYSLLLSGPAVRLAPLYDINSVLPYLTATRRGMSPGQVSTHSARLAMSIGGKARLDELDRTAWASLATASRLPESTVLDRVTAVVEAVPAAAQAVLDEEGTAGQLTVDQQAFVEQFHQQIDRRAGLCRNALLGRGPRVPRRTRRAPTPGAPRDDTQAMRSSGAESASSDRNTA
ncbi:serine/threonine-protein kinase HipA [Geodermatophilus tzadiensis]|uniref:Serine/threonine-protein kinase HipA n=1 Tax=Geodermatophilus tzadiensis TaxID=1137988 RepID=A0A2T0SNS6_9ACTN|nr:type II toxin-antitoxin system HipA family toxin [Geodermatophilus tzadiensis]PRY35082.1 serine/threonine-protein kinase HipA [Geodermatophilus tzadiensis]